MMYPCGFLPARFLKIKCRRGSPIALYHVCIVGVLERVVWREMGPEMGSMIVRSTDTAAARENKHATGVERDLTAALIVVALACSQVEHPEALLLPSKPSMPTKEAPSFPSQQVIKADEHQPPLQRCTRDS